MDKGLIGKNKKNNNIKTEIGPPKPWFELKIFCTKIHRSAIAPTGLLYSAVFSWLFKFRPSGLDCELINISNFEPPYHSFR